MTEENTKPKPLHKIRIGSVSGSCWPNKVVKNGETRIFKTFSFQQSYQDPQTKEWKNFDSFPFKALGNLIMAIFLIAVKEFLDRKDADETSPDDEIPV
jgi:hypothetical protein